MATARLGSLVVPFWTTIALGLIAILCARAGVVNLAASLVLLAALGAFSSLLLEVSTTFLRCAPDATKRFRLLLATSLTLLVGVELVLRFGLHRYETYPERTGWSYVSIYQGDGTPWFSFLGEGPELKYAKTEFVHSRPINSRGIREVEIGPRKAPNEYRVVALGDSFTEGVGAAYDGTWVKVLERRLAARMPDRAVTTINAGISGSDPFLEYMLLRERLLALDPDLVIVCVNPTDVNDVILRGGLDRFRPDGTTRYRRRAPRWEWIYATSYVFRSVVHDLLGYNWYLIKENEMGSAEIDALEELRSALTAYQRLSEERGFDLFVVIHPNSAEEVIDNRYRHQLGRLTSVLKDGKDGLRFVDLLDYYLRNQSMTGRDARDFFWPVDGHHNTKGYEVMGTAIADAMSDS